VTSAVGTFDDCESFGHRADVMGRAALAAVRAMREGADDEQLLADFIPLLANRLGSIAFVVQLRDVHADEWTLLGMHGVSPECAAFLRATTVGPKPLHKSTEWPDMGAIALTGAPWKGAPGSLSPPVVVMPATFSDGCLAGAITVFSPLTPELVETLTDAASLLWLVRARVKRDRQIDLVARQYTALAEFSPDIIWRLDPNGTLIYANRAFERLVGPVAHERIGQSVLESVPGLARARWTAAIERVRASSAMVEVMCTMNGRHLASRLAPEREADGTLSAIVVTTRDMTEQVNLESARKAAESRCDLVSDISKTVIYDRSYGEEPSFVSGSMQSVFGYDPELLTREGVAWWLDRVHPDDRDRVRSAFAGSDSRGADSWSIEYRVERADGTWADILDRGKTLRRIAGAPARAIGAFTDVSEQRALEAEYRHVQKTELLGRLAGGVAHDFNNILTVIRGFTELVRDGTAVDDPRAADIAEIVSAIDHARTLTQLLLGFSRRRDQAQPAMVSAGATLERLGPMLRRLIPPSITLDVESINEPLVTQIDPYQFEQIVLNLAINARDAMPRGGQLSIRTSRRAASPGTPGSHLCVEVPDTGTGISAALQTRIFDRCFTTKAEGQGSGLGLAIIRDIIDGVGGSIGVQSTIGSGSTFTVLLPENVQKEVRPEIAPPVAAAPAAKSVLLIEDDATVRRISRRLLERDGFRVIEASTGDEGIAQLLANRATLNGVISDLTVPGISGAVLIARIREIAPEIGCLVVSGRHDAIADFTSPSGLVSALAKPFHADQFLHAANATVQATRSEIDSGRNRALKAG
jgi:two-component system cell cycle sensor histidine kinase/response regulator CckA